MDSQIENAIEIAWNPTADQSLKSQAFEFLNNLRSDIQAWQVCALLFTRTPRCSPVVRLVSLEIVNNTVQLQSLDGQSLLFLKDTLLSYVRQTYGGGGQDQLDDAALQNKLTQTLTYLFVYMYRSGWESFIDDFLTITSMPNSERGDNPAGVVLYLRILGSIHDEIADVMLSRADGESQRNAELKDLIRERAMHKVAQSWKELLSEYSGRNDLILEMTLRIIGKWVTWIDISLVINQDMLNLLLPAIGRTNPSGKEDKVRDAAIDTFTEIVGKKMRPADKLEMISFLNLREIITRLIASPPLSEFQKTPRYDTDLAEAVAKLVNTVMTDLVRILESGRQVEGIQEKAAPLLQDFLPFLLRFLSDEYDEVCSIMIPALTDLLTFLRKVSQSHTEMLRPILNAIIIKMRYDDLANWADEDEQENEVDFQELRKRLQILQKSVAAVDQDLYIDVLSNLVANTFQTLDQQGSRMDWRDLDLALHEMYLFGELALPNQGIGAKNQPSTAASERLIAMMSKMVESRIADFPHPAVLLQYMEICVRYIAFFDNHESYIPRMLENFVRLLHHDHVRIRTRSWYLFLRLVKQLRGHLGNIAETVIRSISDLLPIKAEVPAEETDDDMSSDEVDNSADAVFTAQLYLFEAIGCISSTSNTPVEQQAVYARSVMDPLFRDMEHHLARAKSGDAQAILQIHHIVMALGTLAQGFADPAGTNAAQKSPPAKAISDEFSRSSEAILIALGELNGNGEIRAACRSAFSRLVNVLGAAVLPQLPQWIEGLLSQSSSKDEMAMFLRVLEQVVYGFKGEIYSVLNILLTPLLQRVFGGLSEPITGTDDEIQLAELRREYLSFLQIILNNNLAEVLVSETNQGFFEELISSILSLARTVSPDNLAASRLAFTVLTRMTSLWGGPDVATISANPSAPTGSPAPVFPGFDQYLIDRFHSVCWEAVQDPRFQPRDAQARSVLMEVASLEQAIYTKTGQAFIAHLRATLFPSLGLDGEEFLRAMTTATDRRKFCQYLQQVCQKHLGKE